MFDRAAYEEADICPEFCDGLLVSYSFKLTLGSGCLELCFWTVPFKTILIGNIKKLPVAFKPEL